MGNLRDGSRSYLHAFELGKLSEATCGYRLEELEKEVGRARRVASATARSPGAAVMSSQIAQ